MRNLPYDLNVRYIKDSANQLADWLSRLDHYRTKWSYILSKYMKKHVGYKPKWAEFNYNMRSLNKIIICVHSNTLCKLVGPNTRGPLQIQPYWNFIEEITIEDSLLLKGTRIMVPPSWRENLLKEIHAGHLGLSKCLHRVRLYIGLNCMMRSWCFFINWHTCFKFSYSNLKQWPSKQLGHEILLVPWSKLATDISHFDNS